MTKYLINQWCATCETIRIMRLVAGLRFWLLKCSCWGKTRNLTKQEVDELYAK